MECKEYSELISTYVDGMLSPQEEGKLMAHLEVCQRCQEELKALKQIQALCDQLEMPDLPKGFHEDLMKRIEKEKSAKKVISFKWKWQYSGALVATLMVGIFGLSGLRLLSDSDKKEMSIEAVPYAMNESASEGVAPAPAQFSRDISVASTRDANQEASVENDVLLTTWKITTQVPEAFRKALEEYLMTEQIQYEEVEDAIICHAVKNSESLMEWIKAQEVTFEGENLQDAETIRIEVS